MDAAVSGERGILRRCTTGHERRTTLMGVSRDLAVFWASMLDGTHPVYDLAHRPRHYGERRLGLTTYPAGAFGLCRECEGIFTATPYGFTGQERITDVSMECSRCDGVGQLSALVYRIDPMAVTLAPIAGVEPELGTWPCLECECTGRLTEARAIRLIAGGVLTDLRKTVLRLEESEAARALGVLPSLWALAEQGKADALPLIARLIACARAR